MPNTGQYQIGFSYMVPIIETCLAQTNQKTRGLSKSNYTPFKQTCLHMVFLFKKSYKELQRTGDYLTTNANAEQRSFQILHSGWLNTTASTQECSRELKSCLVPSLLAPDVLCLDVRLPLPLFIKTSGGMLLLYLSSLLRDSLESLNNDAWMMC